MSRWLRLTHGWWLVGLAAALGGCGSGGGGAATPGSDGVLRGTIVYRERMALPPDATVEVRLEDVSIGDAPADVLAEERFAARDRSVPIPFDLQYPADRIRTNRRYALRAQIRAADGSLLFTSAEDHAVFGGGEPAAPIEILVRRAAGAASADAPWSDAAARGARFRALGNEPFWHVEVHADRLVLVTDLGARRTEIAGVDTVVDGTRTTFRADGGGHRIVVEADRRPCTDSMSGEAFDVTARVTLDRETFHGCGRFL